ncbi:MAG TPA: helix-turn-helix domain-containing protein, partial [Fimbriimonadaceae bacterium]|nr:helix-turn-helix domain-containing protein [Fimbriimonadaceae bacterium]
PNPPILQSSIPRPSRLITLRTKGRGDFANQTWLIDSRGVDDYQLIAHGPDISMESWSRDEAILAPLRDSPTPMTARQIADVTGIHEKTVSNHMTGLVRAGKAVVVGKTGKAPLYVLN